MDVRVGAVSADAATQASQPCVSGTAGPRLSWPGMWTSILGFILGVAVILMVQAPAVPRRLRSVPGTWPPQRRFPPIRAEPDLTREYRNPWDRRAGCGILSYG